MARCHSRGLDFTQDLSSKVSCVPRK
jgi:hypothetical protein